MTPNQWIRYANTGAVRNQALSPKLVNSLGFLPELGVTMEVFSGGQPAKGSGGKRVGSTRHDHGNAADVFFYKDGRRLDWANDADRPVFQEIVKRGKAAGITGFGAGDGYMRPGSMHIGFGSPAVWGAGGKGSNAPDWLMSAYGTPSQSGSAASPSAPSSSPFGSMAPQQSTIPTSIANYAISPEPGEGASFGDRLSAAAKAIDQQLPKPPRISGGGGDARATGNALTEFMSAPTAAEILLKKRLAGIA